MLAASMTLVRSGIEARIPHRGSMCMLDALLEWSPAALRCRITNQADHAHPLRSAGGLLAPCAIEYAAQAMALHSALCQSDGASPSAGFLASARGVRLHVPRLDNATGPLEVMVQLQAASGGHALYRFELHDATGRMLVDGRAAVVLNSPLSHADE